MGVNVSHDITRNKLLEISCRNRAGIHRTVVNGLGIRQDDDHLLRPLRERALDRLRDMDLVTPLLCPYRITMQSINDRIASGFFLCVTWRQKYQYIAVNG